MAAAEKTYIQDLRREGTLTVVPVVSAIPRGRIEGIRLPDMPPQYGILSHSDLRNLDSLSFYGDSLPLFADGEVVYQGQTVLLLYGPDEDQVLRFRDSVNITYETDYSFLGFKGYTPQQVHRERIVRKGQPGKDGRKSRVIKDEFYIIPQPPSRKNSLGAFAFPEDSGIRVYGISQWPFLHQRFVSEILGIPLKEVFFQSTEGSFRNDGPLWLPSLIIVYTALTAWITRQPCRMLLSPWEWPDNREERNFVFLSFSTALNEEGRPWERSIDIDIDGGAYPILCGEILDRLCLSALGTQPLGNVEIRSRIIRTSFPPLDIFNGLGMSQGLFGAEIHNTHIARHNLQDPLNYRKENCLTQGTPFITGGSYLEKASPRDLLSRVGRASDFHRKYGSYQGRAPQRGTIFPLIPRRGIGCSLGYQGNGFLSLKERSEKVTIIAKLDAGEELSIRTAGIPGFPRTADVWKKAAAKILQIDPARIHLSPIDTGEVPDSGPTLFSRNVTIIPRLIEQCCASIQKQRFRAPLPIERRQTFRFPPRSRWDGEGFEGQPFLSLSWAAAVVELEMNPLSWAPEIRGIWMAVDCGRLLDEGYARNILEVSIQRTLEWCTCQSPKKGGGSFPGEGLPPRLRTFPISVEFIQNRGIPPGGLGSLADNVIPAAFAAALSQAAGYGITRLPVIPGDLIVEKEG